MNEDNTSLIQSLEKEETYIPTETVVIAEEPQVEEPVAIEEPLEEKKKVLYKQQYVIQDSPVIPEKQLEEGDAISLPSYFREATEDLLNELPNVRLTASEHARDWADVLRQGMDYLPNIHAFTPALSADGAEFHNQVRHNNGELTAKPPRFKSTENQNIQGEIAVMRIISHLGLGSVMQIPLWHSGIWVTFKPPSESELVELYRRLNQRKIQFGRYTSGLVFSNLSVYFTDEIVDFAIAHIFDLSTKTPDITIDNVKQHIVSQDIPSLIWGLLCSIYPKGFRYRRACIADPLKCTHIVEETIDLTKLQWTNTKALTDWQKNFMSSRQPKFRSLEEIQRYKTESKSIQKTRFSLDDNEDIFVNIKNPSLSEYIDAGHRWIGEIVNAVESVLNVDVSDNEREELIVRHGQSTTLRQYAHWIESIDYGSNVVNDQETIENTLNILSADEKIRNKILQNIVKYINQSTMAVIGIPVYTCPACGQSQEFEKQSEITLPNFTNIIPIDPGLVFFGLIVQRIAKIATR